MLPRETRPRQIPGGLAASELIGGIHYALHAGVPRQISYHPRMKANRFLLAAASLLTVSIAATGQHVHSQATSEAGAQGRLTPMKAHSGPLPALPPVPYSPSRPMAIVQQVYEFAARHPEHQRLVQSL